MVIDTSAIFAAITGEADASIYRSAIISAPLRLISAVTFLEIQIVLVSRSGNNSIPILHELIESAGIAVVPFDEPMAEAAFDAFKRYAARRSNRCACF
jgi:ribonuclease VapC